MSTPEDMHVEMTEQDAEMLEQAASMLDALSNDERNRGNCSISAGAACSAHAVRRLAAALLDANVTPMDMVQVCREDANNYCRILRVLGMEEEGDPVAEVKRLQSRITELEAQLEADHAGGVGAPVTDAASYNDAVDALAVACTGGSIIGPAQMQRALNHFIASRAPTAQPAPAVASGAVRAYISPTRTVADLVSNLMLMDQSLPIYGAQTIEHPEGRRRTIAIPPTVSRERVKDSRWIGEGDTLNAAVIWTKTEQPAPAVVAIVDEDDTGLFADLETEKGVLVKRGDKLYTSPQPHQIAEPALPGVTDADVHAARQILGYKSGQVRKMLESFAASRALPGADAAELGRLKACADEYDAWIRFNDAGNGSYSDFLAAIAKEKAK